MDIQDPVAVEFLTYNCWANLTLIDACCNLPSDQLASSLPGTYGDIYNTFRHIIRAEADYYQRLTNTPLDPPFSWDDRPPLAEIRPYAEQVSSALVGAAGQLAGDGMVREEEGGQIFQYKAMALLIQVVNHGVEHRTNITTILAHLGIETPGVDGWGYLESHPDRLGG